MTARVALVTGGIGGIGTAICRHLAQAGHRVATNYRDEGKSRAWQAAQKADGFEFALAAGDVSDVASSEAMVRDVESQGEIENLTVRGIVLLREPRQLRRKDEDAHDHRQTDGLEQIELEPVVVRHLAALDPERLEDLMQIDGIETKMMGKPVDRCGSRIAQQERRQIPERGLDSGLAPPGRA